jgi:hypothetical protein
MNEKFVPTALNMSLYNRVALQDLGLKLSNNTF